VNTRAGRGEEFDNTAERNFLVAMQVINCEASAVFQSGDPERGALKLDDLLMGRVGAWSVAIASIVHRPAPPGGLSIQGERSGGFILKLVSYSPTSASVRAK